MSGRHNASEAAVRRRRRLQAARRPIDWAPRSDRQSANKSSGSDSSVSIASSLAGGQRRTARRGRKEERGRSSVSEDRPVWKSLIHPFHTHNRALVSSPHQLHQRTSQHQLPWFTVPHVHMRSISEARWRLAPGSSFLTQLRAPVPLSCCTFTSLCKSSSSTASRGAGRGSGPPGRQCQSAAARPIGRECRPRARRQSQSIRRRGRSIHTCRG